MYIQGTIHREKERKHLSGAPWHSRIKRYIYI